MTVAFVVNYPIFHADDDNGAPLAGGLLYSYEGGAANTPKALYQDYNLRTEHTNPIELDERGEAKIWGSGVYYLKLTDATGNLVWTHEWYELINFSSLGKLLVSRTTIEHILDDLELSTSHEHVFNEQPSETPNSIRTGFSTTYKFDAGTIQVYINGVRQRKDYHYTEDADRRGYDFAVGAPQIGWVLQHDYIKSTDQSA